MNFNRQKINSLYDSYAFKIIIAVYKTHNQIHV